MALNRELISKIYEIKAHNGNVNCLDLGETGGVLVTGGQDRNVNLWAIGQRGCFMTLNSHNRPIDCVRFAYNDDYVYSADDIGIIRRWDLNAQTISSTLNGHMKSVQTLDFNPSGEYVVSGSNDTTVRLWDVRNQNKCIKIYRGHMAPVNSVKFSPDGLWIASAGTEGSVIIWDIRKSKQIMDFIDQAPITCIQFHPFEFLLAVGRNDGTVCIYDLEKQERIARTDACNQFYGFPIKCITFSENGECLFVGTSAGISVIGWEPDRVFHHIPSTWTALGDMKVVKQQLILGSYENDYVSISALRIDRVKPFYNPANSTTVPPSAFNHNSTTRRSFTRGNQKLRLTITGPKASRLVEENEDSKTPSLDDNSSPNLSLEMEDETNSADMLAPTSSIGNGNGNGNISYEGYDPSALQPPSLGKPYPQFSSMASTTTGYSSLGGNGFSNSGMGYEGPISLKVPGEHDPYDDGYGVPSQSADPFHVDNLEFNLNESNYPIISNYEHNEMVEDFPVNQNIHQTNGTAGSGSIHVVSSSAGASDRGGSNKVIKGKSSALSQIQKRSTMVGGGVVSAAAGTRSTLQQQRNRLSQISQSVSTTDLHKLDDNLLLKKSTSSHLLAHKGSAGGGRTIAQMNKENNRNKNFTVQIITKAPTRSKTSLDLRSSQKAAGGVASNGQARQSYIPVSNYRPDPSLLTHSNNMRSMPMDDSEIQRLSAAHEPVYQELSNRYATLQMIRNSTRANDIVGALKQAIKMSGRTVFVDLLGAILEKTSSWNLDLCLLLLPEIYELLQSSHKFHYIRACDTLRVILSNFLPIIKENLDPWSACSLGVDVTREERQRKCIECQSWLLQIRKLPETTHFGSTLTQLQNMIEM